jgi:biopolymer transport protein ExbB
LSSKKFNKNKKNLSEFLIAAKTREDIKDIYNNLVNNPFAMVVFDAVKNSHNFSDDFRTEIGYIFFEKLNSLFSSISSLKLISVISPLLGLLGTVIGMLDIFKVLSTDVSPSPNLLAQGISQALITTVLGLVVAIPTLVSHFFINLKIKLIHNSVVKYTLEILKSNGKNES